MTITSSVPRSQQVTGAGTTKINIPFEFEKAQDLLVYKTVSGATPDPAADILTLNTDYTVTGAGYDNPTAPRYITLTVASALNDTYTIVREMPIERSTNFNVSGEFSAADLNNQFDDLVAMVQQVNMKLEKLGLLYKDNAILGSGGEHNVLPKLPANTGDGIPIWTTNSSGDLVAGNYTEGEGYSTLRSELINNQSGSEGAKSIGYFNDLSTPKNTFVQDALDELYARPSNNGFLTGDMKMSFSSLFDPDEWMEYDDGYLKLTTFDPADERPVHFGDTYEDLYAVLWNSCSNDQAPVIGGRGASAAADWAADKALRMPLMVGRSFGLYGQPILKQDFTISGEPTTILTVESTSQYQDGMKIQLTSTGTLPTGLSVLTDYWIKINSNTEVILYTSEINYTDGIPINPQISSTGSGTHTIEVQYTETVLGEIKGYDDHILTQLELPKHRHNVGLHTNGIYSGDGRFSFPSSSHIQHTDYTGSSNAFSIQSPISYVKLLIKL